MDDRLIESGNHKIDGGESAMIRLLTLAKRPSAVLASNDLTAIGALRAIYNAGLRVPDDISVVGYDDIDFSQYTQPALTTVRLIAIRTGGESARRTDFRDRRKKQNGTRVSRGNASRCA